MSAVPATSLDTARPPDAASETSGRFDWVLFLTATGLAAFGLLMMLSASSQQADRIYGNAFHFVGRQTSALGMGLALSLASYLVPWRQMKRAGLVFYGVVFSLLVVVFFMPAVNGSHRWIKLGFVNVQPSEYAKIAVIVVLASYLSANEGRMRDFWGTLVPAAFIPAPLLLLVLFEPDFGSFLILTLLTATLLVVAGLQKRWIALGGLLGGTAVTLLMLIEPYRVRRIVSFVDPFADESGSGYQVVQGWIALASGGYFGQGLGTGVAQSGFLPEAHTDFISAVVGEEIGVMGWIGLTVAYMVLVWRGTNIAARAPDLFGTLVAMGITTMLGMQAVINLGVVCGMLPAKGLVLPFMSYGASAATVHVICVGLLLRVGLEGGKETVNP